MARKAQNRRKDNKRNKKTSKKQFNAQSGANYKSADIEADVIKDFALPHVFPKAVKDEVAHIVKHQSNPKDLLQDPEREDLTNLPLITIDGEDARDFDDAVYAHADTDPANLGGHILWVAIADVSHYVRPGTALDEEAKLRGTSVYFPSQVIPMLPEELSNGLCSLKPNEYRACTAYKIKISAEGQILDADFKTGVMKSKARLTYNQVLDAINGCPDKNVQPIKSTLIKPLYDVFKCLKNARHNRNAIEFGYSETVIRYDRKTNQGPFFSVMNGDEAHSLIEEAMIAANICAASDQENNAALGVYRVQDLPFARKPDIKSTQPEPLSELQRLGVRSASHIQYEQEIGHKAFKKLLAEARSSKDPSYAESLVLRMQQKAIYSHENVGHFCLDLQRYSHFTSPIRRYPDLMTHRNLKATFNKKAGLALDKTMGDADVKNCVDTERTANNASKEVDKLYTFKHLHAAQGQPLKAEIISVSAARGLRMKLVDCNYDANIRLSDLPKGRYKLDASKNALVNTKSGHVFTIGDTSDVMVNFRFDDGYDRPDLTFRDVNGFKKTKGGPSATPTP